VLRAELLQMSEVDEHAQWRRLDAALHGFFRGRVSDEQVRADLVQDVLLRIHERREQLRDDDRLSAWAFRVARNALVDHYRGAPAAEALPELSVPGHDVDLPNDAPQVLGSWLRGQIDSLPPRYREALELTELRGLSQVEAARELGVPTSTLKSRVQRGRALLHAELLSCCAVELDVRGRVTDFTPRAASNATDACDCDPSSCTPPPGPGKLDA
jgi:RNA polymerase sigma-70 factor (ECF subfamily)